MLVILCYGRKSDSEIFDDVFNRKIKPVKVWRFINDQYLGGDLASPLMEVSIYM